jgi:hypothetical protein
MFLRRGAGKCLLMHRSASGAPSLQLCRSFSSAESATFDLTGAFEVCISTSENLLVAGFLFQMDLFADGSCRMDAIRRLAIVGFKIFALSESSLCWKDCLPQLYRNSLLLTSFLFIDSKHVCSNAFPDTDSQSHDEPVHNCRSNKEGFAGNV